MGKPSPAEAQPIPDTDAVAIPKTPTQIRGLDDILHGGLPTRRVTLVGGGPGTGKTVFGLEFLYRGALSDEPGIFLTFEESADNIRRNASAFGWDLAALEKSGRLFVMEGALDPQVLVSGDINLLGCLSIIAGKARAMGARQVVIDALDVLMEYFDDPVREKREILAFQNWLGEQGMTTILTTKAAKERRGVTAYDYLDFMADCVIHLDQRIENQVNTKRLQVIKYRGSGYGSNEYPYIVTPDGLFFHGVSDMWLEYTPSGKRVSSGHEDLDAILGGGFIQGSTVLLSGMTGSGKTSFAATFARSASDKGRKVLYVNFEESRGSLVVGMRSIGVDLDKAIEDGALRVLAEMPESKGIEEHLYDKIKAIEDFSPDHLVVDAISACKRIAGENASFDFIMRLVNYCRLRGITIVLINQAANQFGVQEISGIGVSSIIDTILLLQYEDHGDETRRRLQVLKSRGSRHSNRWHGFSLTDAGIRIDLNRSTAVGLSQAPLHPQRKQ